MIKKLVRHGNSLALIIDKPILELLKIDEDTPLEISTDGKALFASPVGDLERRERIAASSEKAHKKYGRMFERLAK